MTQLVEHDVHLCLLQGHRVLQGLDLLLSSIQGNSVAINTGGKSAFTQQAHGEFIVSSETKCPPNTQQAHGEYF